MKNLEQRKAQQKRHFYSNSVTSVVWVNFVATDKDGVNYISGHTTTGTHYTLSSKGDFYKGVEYGGGYLILKADGIITQLDCTLQLSEIKGIDNSDYSKPAPSANVRKFIEEFEITY